MKHLTLRVRFQPVVGNSEKELELPTNDEWISISEITHNPRFQFVGNGWCIRVIFLKHHAPVYSPRSNKESPRVLSMDGAVQPYQDRNMRRWRGGMMSTWGATQEEGSTRRLGMGCVMWLWHMWTHSYNVFLSRCQAWLWTSIAPKLLT